MLKTEDIPIDAFSDFKKIVIDVLSKSKIDHSRREILGNLVKSRGELLHDLVLEQRAHPEKYVKIKECQIMKLLKDQQYNLASMENKNEDLSFEK